MSMNTPSQTGAHTINTWWMKGSNRLLRGWLMYMLPVLIVWNIWKLRNKHRHQNVPMTLTTILEQIRLDTIVLYKAAQKLLPTKSTDPEMLKWLSLSPHVEKASMPIIVRWIARPYNWAKINCDGSSRGNPGHSGGGGLLHDHKGEMILAYGNYYGINTSLFAKTKALCDGLEMANNNRISQLWVEVDSMVLYNMVMGHYAVPWNLSYIFRKIISLLPTMFYISHNFSEENMTADLMENMATDS